MFCGNCGKEIKSEAKFCPNCGAAVNRPSASASPQPDTPSDGPIEPPVQREAIERTIPAIPVMSRPAEQSPNYGTDKRGRKSKKKGIIIAIAVVAVMILAFTLLGNNPVSTIKTGKLNQYPEQTIGDAFEGFFGNPEWTSYEQDGDTYVKFTGECTFYGELVNAKVVFLIDDDKFSIDRFELEGTDMTYLLESMLDEIYAN